MTWFQALVLGAIQGAAEFLPISSSGHLVLIPWLLGWEIDAAVLFPFTVVLHWGTLVAVIAAFWNDLVLLASAAFQGLRTRNPFGSTEAKLAWLLILATTPAAIAGVLFGDVIEQAFARPELVAMLLLINAGILMTGEWFRTRRDSEAGLSMLRVPDAIVIGLFQVLALFPGISRSGSTIVGGLSRGLGRLESARFALLLAVPIMLGAGVITLSDFSTISSEALQELTVGFVAAVVVGFASIRWLLRFLSHGSLRGFAAYSGVVGTLGLAIAIFRA
ncbi:MAG: undecaprenyl-diphosphatase UppP [Anaerolineae bacterium]|nr:MAG: undecaprenyl-diphosphatase UppP [Anaerolineae bacterium]